jgi:hypothetical protein
MSYHIAVTERNASVNGMTALFNKGANPNPASINFYSNSTTQPATPETAVPGGAVILSTINFVSGAFTSAVGATGVANSLPLSGNVLVTGTPGWFRFFRSCRSIIRRWYSDFKWWWWRCDI